MPRVKNDSALEDGKNDFVPEEASPEIHQGMTQKESDLVEINRMQQQQLGEMQQRLRRLESIADQSKAASYDEKQKDFTTRKMIGTTQRESYAWEISLRNTKTEAVKIIVEDQVPVSQNAQIEVSLLNAGGAVTEGNTGKLTWIVMLQPNESKKMVYSYEVKYPKDKRVSGL